MSCGSWRFNGKAGDPMVAIQLNWILGFLSGRASSTQVDLLANVDGPSVKLWVDNYCRANPLDDLVKASYSLERELASRVPPKSR